MQHRGPHQTHNPRLSELRYTVLPPLSPQETAILFTRFARSGLADACRFSAAWETILSNKVVQANVLKSSVLQAILLFSAFAIRPVVGRLFGTGSRNDSSDFVVTLFNLFWMYPLLGTSFYFSGLFNLRVAERTPSIRTDRRHGQPKAKQNYKGLTARLVAESYRGLLILNWLSFAWVLYRVPFVGKALCFAYYCVVNSYYCFETHWIKQGWGLDERIEHLESRWAYFLGFGVPVTFASWWSADPIVNVAIFSLLFPHLMIMAQSSVPQPLDPALPTSAMSITLLPKSQSSFSMAAAEGGEEARGRQGHPYVPKRLPVLVLADVIYSFLMKNFAPKKKDAQDGHATDAAPWQQQPAAMPHAGYQSAEPATAYAGTPAYSGAAPPPQQMPTQHGASLAAAATPDAYVQMARKRKGE